MAPGVTVIKCRKMKAHNKKPVGVLCFPGTQCDQDVVKAIESLRLCVKTLWHADSFSYKDFLAFILPGGFSYGDYLRAGALSAHSPAMREVCRSAHAGWPVLGICNGFQILCEAGLLEGALRINHSLRFIDEWVQLKLCHPCPTWGGDKVRSVARVPIAHSEGSFYASKDTMKKLTQENRIWLKYVKNPNGSLEDTAGIMNKAKNVAGLMPHPERAMTQWMGGTDGMPFFQTLL